VKPARLKSWLIASVIANVFGLAAGAWLWTGRHDGDDAEYERRLRQERREVLATRPVERADVVLLGDSLTERGQWAEWMSAERVVNRGVAGERTDQVAERVPDIASLNPRVLFVLAGTNDLAQGRSIDQIAASYQSLLTALRDHLPTARIVVTSVPPIRNEPRRRPWGADVVALNLRLSALAEENHLEVLDLHATLVEEQSGELCKACTLDGVHLTGEGYRRWLDAMTPFRAPELPDSASSDVAPGLWGVPALDALWDLPGIDGNALIWEVGAFERSLTAATSADLLKRLGAAAKADFGALSPAARAVAQNDLWGLLQRLRGTSAGGALELESALETLILRLAPDDKWLAARSSEDIPAHAARLLPAEDGWHEMDTEHAVLSHERAFGLRRVFRLLSRGTDGHALLSQLVALDARGAPHLTNIVGEIEQLRMSGGRAAEARVWELDRQALRKRGVHASLHEAERISHIPGRGATSFLLELEAPETVASLPCLRCHDDPNAFSLPIPPVANNLSERRARLLAQATLRPAK